jgi:hypothetical protein
LHMKLDTATRDPTRYYSVLGTKGPADLDLIVVPLQVHQIPINIFHNPTHTILSNPSNPYCHPNLSLPSLPPCYDRVLSPIIQQQYQQHYHRHPHRHHARTNHDPARCTVPGSAAEPTLSPSPPPTSKKEKKGKNYDR